MVKRIIVCKNKITEGMDDGSSLFSSVFFPNRGNGYQNRPWLANVVDGWLPWPDMNAKFINGIWKSAIPITPKGVKNEIHLQIFLPTFNV